MNFTREELRRLALPLLSALGLLALGAALIWGGRASFGTAQREFAATQAERRQNAERLARIAEEEREVSEKLDVYKQLKSLNILGEERRLEWADAITRIRKQRELLDLSYRVDLRASGNAYYSVRSCSLARTGQAATGATIAPRLRAQCEIDLVTVIDRGAKG